MSEIKSQEEENQKPENIEKVTMDTSYVEENKQGKPVSSDIKTMIVLTHILPLFVSFLAPLAILLTTKEEIVKKHSKASLNWQFSLLIYYTVSVILMLVLVGFLILPVLVVVSIIFSTMATIKSSENPNKVWQYPLSIKFFN